MRGGIEMEAAIQVKERFDWVAAIAAFAENQPVTSIVEAIRSLLSEQPVGNQIWVALAWCLSICIVAYVFAKRYINVNT